MNYVWSETSWIIEINDIINNITIENIIFFEIKYVEKFKQSFEDIEMTPIKKNIP